MRCFLATFRPLIRTSADHFSLSFTYAWLAATKVYGGECRIGLPREVEYLEDPFPWSASRFSQWPGDWQF